MSRSFPLLDHFPPLPTPADLLKIELEEFKNHPPPSSTPTSSSTPSSSSSGEEKRPWILGALESMSQFDPNTLTVLRGCHYILNLIYPNPAKGVAGFKADVLIPIISTSNRVANHTILRKAVSFVVGQYVDPIKERLKSLHTQGASHIEILAEYSKEWRRYSLVKRVFEVCLRNIFREQTDRNSSSPIQSEDVVLRDMKDSVTRFFFDRWKTSFLEPLQDTLRPVIHSLTEKYRRDYLQGNHDPNDAMVIKNTVNSYFELSNIQPPKGVRHDMSQKNVYVANWEEPFLENTKTFYEMECGVYVSGHTVTEYLGMCNKILDLEDSISRSFIVERSREAHAKVINNAVVCDHRQPLQDAICGFVDNTDIPNLKVMHRLFVRIDEIDVVMNMFVEFCEKRYDSVFGSLKGELDAMTPRDLREIGAIKYITAFLETYYFMQDIITNAFEKNIKIIANVDNLTRKKLNNNPVSPMDDPMELTANFAAKYGDKIASDVHTSYSDMLSNRMMVDGLIAVFNFIVSKDVFCKRYRIFFSIRLLKGAVNVDIETAMINKFRGLYDTQFAQQLTIMLRDIAQSKEKYSSVNESASSSSIGCVPTILTGSSWPLDETEQKLCINLPKVIEDESSAFMKRFKAFTDGKEVDWLHEKSVSIVEIRTDRMYLITMNHIQTSVFMVISDKGDQATLQEISSLTNLSEEWTIAALNSFLAVNLVQQNPKTKRYRITPTFKGGMIKLNATVKFVRPVKDNFIDPTIEEERGLKTQAAIVRIMKARRVLDHATLLEEVTKQTSRFFSQNSERVQRQIERLINSSEKYLERQDAKTYRYVTGTD